MKKTKVICTLGPTSSNVATLKKMISAGMDCVRINTAHGDIKQYANVVKNVRIASKKIPIMLDVKGPEIRVRLQKEIEIEYNQLFQIGFSKTEFPYFSCNFYDQVNINQKVYFDNGAIETIIVSKKNKKLVLKALTNATIKQNKGVNIPNTEINIPPLSEKDKEVIEFALKHDIAFIALSFTRTAKDILDLRKKLGDKNIAIIAKIENHQGIKNFNEILEESDGIMIARGDLGVEIPAEKIPLIQKDLIKRCNQAGKIVITATQMLETMINNPTPTRAETSDVANAILDGSDVLMLSGETAIGKFPIKVIETITKITKEVEPMIKSNVDLNANGTISTEIAKATYVIAKQINAHKIVCLTRSGFTARMLSRFRLNKNIIAITPNNICCQQLGLVYGVKAYVGKEYESKPIIKIAKMLYAKGVLSREDNVVFTAGFLSSFMKASNRIEVHNIGDMMDYLKKHGM